MHTLDEPSQSKARKDRPCVAESHKAKADGWQALARLPVTPFSLNRVARKTNALQATVAMGLTFLLSVSLPFTSFGAATNEPFHDLTWYANDIVAGVPLGILWTLPFFGLLIFVLALPARYAESQGRPRLAIELRAIMLAPTALLIPMALWCVMFAGWLTNKPGFNLFWYEERGIRPLSRHSLVIFLGDWRWWSIGAIAAVLLAYRAIRSFDGMPRLDGMPYCQECLYNLVGNKTGICPECGLAIDAVGSQGPVQVQGVVPGVTTNSAVAETGCE